MKEAEKSGRLYEKRIAVFLALNIVAVCIYILMIKPGYIMHDAHYWVYRIGALADEMRIRGGIHTLPPRILSVTFDGYGYGAPLFYCDVFLWLPAVLVLYGVSEFTSFNLLCAAIWSVRAAFAFFSANLVLKQFSEIKDRCELAVLFAFAYSCFPYMIEILLVRGAIGESIASIFFPLIVAMLYIISHVAQKNPKHTILLALGLFGVVCSHTVSAVITACCMIVYILCHRKLFWGDKWKFIELFKACVLTAGLSAFWLFPFMEQYFSHILPDMEGWWWHNIVSLSDWFISRYYIQNRLIWYPSTFGIPLVVWTILYFVQTRVRKNKLIRNLLLVSWLLCIFMTFRSAMKVMELLLGFMQFAWRLLLIVALLLSIVIVIVFGMSTKKKWIFCVIYITYAACLLLSDSEQYYYSLISDTTFAYDSNSADTLFIPEGGGEGNIWVHDVRGEFVDTNLTELQFGWERLPKAQLRLKYSNNTGNAVVQLPLYYYKGYQAYDQVNQSRLFIEKGDIGLIWVHLNSYEAGEVVVSYVGTMIQKISNGVSVFTWILLVFLVARKTKIRLFRRFDISLKEKYNISYGEKRH